MTLNKEDLKNKIIYRSLYRGTKEMDIMVSSYVKKIINDLKFEDLLLLNDIVNMGDEDFVKLFNNKNLKENTDSKIDKFIKRYKI
tara:strand:+ start:618 stop:872 length:255 start_codon:yes stop_codon:yes gene_type:complete